MVTDLDELWSYSLICCEYDSWLITVEMDSTDVKLGGAWAAFEQQQVDREAVIDSLCTQVSYPGGVYLLRCVWSLLYLCLTIFLDLCQLAELTSMHQQLCQDYDQLQKAYNASVGKSQQMAADLDIASTQIIQLQGQVETGKFLIEVCPVA